MAAGITLAMIVKNEAAKLPRCLDSVRGAVDEMVIVDTGSSDGSAEIARAAGAKVEQIEWPDSFAEARNVSLESIATEWVLWLDADEWLVPGAGSQIRDGVAQPGAFAYLLVRRDIFPDGGYSEQQLLRLWRHHPDLHFRGAIHESLSIDAMRCAFPDERLMATDIAFWHDGYSATLTPEKARRNLPLLRHEAAENSETLYFEIELAQTLKTLGDPEGVRLESSLADRLVALRDQDEPPDNTAALFLMRYLADLPDGRLAEERTEFLLRLGRGWFPDHPGVRSICAQIEIRRGELRRALDDLLEVEQMAETGKFDRLTSSHPSVLREGLSTNLALVAHQLGKRDLAKKHYLRLLEFDPNNLLARQNLSEL